MKRIFLFSAIMLFYSSCYKVNEDNQHFHPTVYDVVSVSGFNMNHNSTILSINDSAATAATVYISLMKGDPPNDKVSCFFSDLPSGVTTSFDTTSRMLPATFNGTITAKCDTGLYTIKLNVSSRNMGLKQYTYHLHILPVIDGAPGLTGTYSGSDPCGHFSIGNSWYNYTSSVSAVPGKPHWISIKNYRGLGDSIFVYAAVTCTDAATSWVGSINIPVQTVNGYTIFGRGKGYYGIQENQRPWISVYGDTIIHAGDTQTCYTQLKQ
jgi:hypothetical protein